MKRVLLGCLCVSISTLAGCASRAIPDVPWRIVIGDREGKLSIITTTSRDMFRLSPRLQVARVSGTVDQCRIGWYDPASQALTTFERNDVHSPAVVRLYDSQMRLAGECNVQGSDWSSCPSIFPGGGLVAVVNENSELVIGTVMGDSVAWRTICRLPAVRSFAHLDWLGAESIAVAGNSSIYVVNIADASYREIDYGTLLGLADGMMVSADKGEVVVLGSDGKPVRRLGFRMLPNYGGVWVNRVSPDGQFAAYEEPSLFMGTALVFEHLASGKKTYIRRLKTPIHMGSWQVMADPKPTSIGSKVYD